MLKQSIQKAVPWLPHAFAVAIAAALVAIYWQGSGSRDAWRHTHAEMVRHAHAGALAWRQPVLPQQYEQASCGACHHEDLPQTPRLNHGRALLVRYNCIGCHTLQGVERPAMLAPDLSSVGTKVSREWIYKWLKEPRTILDADGNVVVDGVATQPRMPQFRLSDEELRALSAFLSVQKAQPVAAYHFSASAMAAARKNGDPADAGEVRFNQMFCVTCHSLSVDRGGVTQLIGGDIGPELTKVGSKVNPQWLVAWLRDPQGYLQHTKMPRYQWSDQDLYEVSQYVETRLTDPDLLSDVPKLGAPTPEEVQEGRQLFQDKGCIQCHAMQGMERRQNFAPNLAGLGMAPGPYLFQVQSHFGQAIPMHFPAKRDAVLDISVGKIPRFLITYIQAKITNPVSVTPETHMPQFAMNQSDLDDLTTAVLSMTGGASTAEELYPMLPKPHPVFQPSGAAGELYQRYRCYVCHTFNGYGGTLAPNLSYEGSRSQHDWIAAFLQKPQTLRPTLTARMPEFNMPQQDAQVLADFLTSTMRNPAVDPNAVSASSFTPEMAARGKHLYEGKFQCQSCHTIGSSGGYVGPSLNNAGNWLTPAWMEAWLHNPQALLPGTIEPRQKFTEQEIQDITAYLLTLKQAPEQAEAAGAGGQP